MLEALKRFVDSLSFMGIGMASIIIVIAVLIVAVLLINLFTSDKVKTSRKIIFISALVVCIIGVTLLNGARLKNEDPSTPTPTPPVTASIE